MSIQRRTSPRSPHRRWEHHWAWSMKWATPSVYLPISTSCNDAWQQQKRQDEVKRAQLTDILTLFASYDLLRKIQTLAGFGIWDAGRGLSETNVTGPLILSKKYGVPRFPRADPDYCFQYTYVFGVGPKKTDYSCRIIGVPEISTTGPIIPWTQQSEWLWRTEACEDTY